MSRWPIVVPSMIDALKRFGIIAIICPCTFKLKLTHLWEISLPVQMKPNINLSLLYLPAYASANSNQNVVNSAPVHTVASTQRSYYDSNYNTVPFHYDANFQTTFRPPFPPKRGM